MKLSTIPYYLEALTRLVYPADCGVCAQVLEIHESGVCEPCGRRLESLRFSYEDSSLHPRASLLGTVWSAFPYEGEVRTLLTGIKFQKKRWLADLLSPAIDSILKIALAESSWDRIASIPMDLSKLIEREYCFTGLLAQKVHEISQVPFSKDLLKKQNRIPAQSHLSRIQRLANPYGAFQLRRPETVRDQNILIIDDIYTTGATLEEAARLLYDNGARNVDGFTLARTLIS